MYFVYFFKHNDDVIYIGSTQDVEKRLKNHKKDKNRKGRKHYKLYTYLRENSLDIYDLNCEYLDIYVENVKQLRQVEGQFIRDYNPICNLYIAGRTYKEYYKDNKDKFSKYYIDNKEKIRLNYQENKEKISKYNQKYRKNNKEKINERKRLNYQENKEYFNERQKERRYKENTINFIKNLFN